MLIDGAHGETLDGEGAYQVPLNCTRIDSPLITALFLLLGYGLVNCKRPITDCHSGLSISRLNFVHRSLFAIHRRPVGAANDSLSQPPA